MDAPRYRIGNTLTVLWSICNNDGTPFDLSSKDIKLFFTNSRGATQIEDYTIVENGDSGLYNIIRWEYSGDDQKTLGDHTLTIEIYPSGSNRKIKRDVCKAFCLVSRSESEESGGEGNILDSGSLILSSNLDVYRFGRASVEIGTNGNWYIDGFDTGKSALAGGPGLVKNIYNESDLSREFDKNSVIDTFNADTIKKIYDALKGFTMKDITDLSIADLETNDIVAFNGDNWVSIPFKTLFDIYRRTEFVSIAGEGGGDGYWYLDETDGRVHIDKDIYVHGNVIVDGDTASGGTPGDSAGGGSIDTLSDVTLNNLADGDVLVYNNENKKWENTPQSDIVPDLDEYVKKEELNEIKNNVNEMWQVDADGNVVTAKPVQIHNDLVVNGDVSSVGVVDESTQVGGGITPEEVIKILEDNGYATIDDIATEITKIINGAPDTLDTLGEIADAFMQYESIVDAINAAIVNKANSSDVYKKTETYTRTEIDNKDTALSSAISTKANASDLNNYLPLAGGEMTGVIKKSSGSIVEDVNGNGIVGVDVTSGAWTGVPSGDAFGTIRRATTIRSNGTLQHYNHSHNDVNGGLFKILTTYELSDANITALKSILGKISVDSSGNVVINTNLIVNGDTSSK